MLRQGVIYWGVEGWGLAGGGATACRVQQSFFLEMEILFVFVVIKMECVLYSLTERRMDVTEPLFKVRLSS